ncbi:MAG: hypothetical protein SVV80_13925 [Planctomycetota bacterium]|nr:hypothetical protein [Planctomycetota bacterium]
MTNQSSEQTQEVSAQVDPDLEPRSSASADSAGREARLVPVNEAIKYRRRAQQAETSLQQFEQRLKDTQAQLDERLEQLAQAESQRDELRHQIDTMQMRSSAERILHGAGVVDIETAMALLDNRGAFCEDLDAGQVQQAVDQLLQDKPILTTTPPALPGKTASSRLDGFGSEARLARSAAQAAQSGNRRDVAEYLRLRRNSNNNY